MQKACASQNLLSNGSFEKVIYGQAEGWTSYKNGYKTSEGSGRNSSTAAYCKNENDTDQSGLSQSLELKANKPVPILVKGWSKCRNVSGSKGSGYSLYVDVIYDDGTPLWGQTGNFNTNTHDWEEQSFLIIPEKPVERLTIYGMFRGHSGEVWFDDFQVSELDNPVLDGVPIESLEKTPSDISLEKLHEKGFLVRDVAADSPYYMFDNGLCTELSLKLDASMSESENCLYIEGSVSDTTNSDRAITLLFALPIDAVGWKWHDDIRHYRIIYENAEYMNAVNIHTGSNGMMSLYPFGCISNDKDGIAMAIDMDLPAQYRIAYNSFVKRFFIAYDFGLSEDTDNFPGSAHFRFIIYKTDPEWGFRSAAKNLFNIFPDYFVCRSKDQGIWMPFTDISTVEGWEDFGFKYHEGINNVPFDDKANILSFRYTEPSTWWMSMSPKTERTHENIMSQLHDYAKSDDLRKKKPAEAAIISGSFNEQGSYQYQVLNTPWSNGAVFSLNPSPYIPGNSEARMKWNDEDKRRLYGKDAKGEQDGEYLDSLEGYVTADENFRRDHFHHVTVPLTFSTSSKKPVIHKAFSVYEFSKWMADDIHKMGKLMFANSVPHTFSFLCPFFDVMGTEMNWIGDDGKWMPASDSWMNLKRTMCYQKPYLFLMNTRYESFTPDLVEKYFQRSLFYGMYPSMFSHNASEDPYWQNPALYNRDRHLFKRYIPIIKKVAEAGWEPVTHAVTDSKNVYIERFGPDSDGNIYFTLLNDSSNKVNVNVTLMISELGIKASENITDLLSEEIIKPIINEGSMTASINMAPERVRVLLIKAP